MQPQEIPTAYRAGWQRTRLSAPVLADRYAQFTLVGDPLADAVIVACQSVPAEQQMAWISQAVACGAAAVPDAPQELRDFITAAHVVPAWFDPKKTLAGCRAFHGNSELFIAAFVGAVLIEGFSTLISQSFSITGKLVDKGTDRLKQNNLQLAEIFMPGGIESGGDGFKLSIRIRLVHARVRFMLKNSPEWEGDAWGVPLCASHIAYGTAAFSGGLLVQARKLGARLTAEEEASFMMIWRYAGHLMGVPEALQVASKAQALEFVAAGKGCEPAPTMESIQLANSLVNSAPFVAGITDPVARGKLIKTIFRASRALIGDKLADQLNYPKTRHFGILTAFRLRSRLDGWARRCWPYWDQRRRFEQFQLVLGLSTDGRINYRLPQHLHAEKNQAE